MCVAWVMIKMCVSTWPWPSLSAPLCSLRVCPPPPHHRDTRNALPLPAAGLAGVWRPSPLSGLSGIRVRVPRYIRGAGGVEKVHATTTDTGGIPPITITDRNRIPPPASPLAPWAVRALRPASRLPVRAHCQPPKRPAPRPLRPLGSTWRRPRESRPWPGNSQRRSPPPTSGCRPPRTRTPPGTARGRSSPCPRRGPRGRPR